MLRSGFRTRGAWPLARPRSARTARFLAARFPARTPARAAALLLLTAAGVAAQTALPPAGFAAASVFANATHAPAIHRIAAVGDGRHLVAWQHELYETRGDFDPARDRRLVRLSEPIAFVDSDGATAFAGGLASGRVLRIDLATRAVALHAHGVANTFDVVPLGGGDLLAAANPLWPAGGAHSGVWLVGPGRMPRELLPLTGPSGPIALDAAGDLIAAEIGHAGPGTARLLRVPAARLQQALAGGALTLADVAAVGTGYAAIHDLACADGRVFVSDAASSVVLATTSGALAPASPWLDVGAGRFATTLQRCGGGAAPFAGWMPPEHAGALLVTRCDFVASIELLHVAPRRPQTAVAAGAMVPPGPTMLLLAQAPANGIAAWLASLPSATPELPLLALGGTPLWLALDPASTVALGLVALDPSGGGASTFTNPGGTALQLVLQAAAFGAAPGELGTAAPLAVQLLP